MKSTLIRAGLVALMVGAIAGCGGGGGGGGGAAAPAPAPAPAPTGPTLAPAPTPTGATTINVGTLTTDQLAALAPQVVLGGALVASPPKVSFAIQDANKNPIIGFGAASSGSLTYLRFSIAKLVPGANGSPSKWVNYIVVDSAGAAQRPNAERNGTLVDNGNGTYVYTFATDITKVKDQVAAMTLTAPNSAADLGDLTYDANLTHRLTIQLSGGGMENPVNAIYDFIPATGKAVTSTDAQREVVSIDSCNSCHGKLALHGGGRVETKYCVVCHTDQRRYGRTNTTSTALAFPALTETKTVSATTGYTSYSYSPTTYVGDGETMGDFTRMVHKIHQGHDLVKQNYNYANVAFNLKAFSMLGGGQRSCAKCHDSTKAAQADNYKNVPSRLACGACHDGINFATGSGTTLAGLTTGHVGKSQSSDQACYLCHSAADINVYHQTTDKTKHNPTVEAGLVTFTYEIQSASVDATTNAVTVKFKISADGTALTTVSPTGFTSGPSFLLAWAVPQDNIATPVDFNNTTNLKGDATSVTFANSTITGPDSSGYFTATIASARGFPAGAKMRTVALQGGYTQSAGTNGIAANTARNAISVAKTVTGDTERRKVIDPAKCSNCHEWLKLHGGSRVLAPETMGNVNVCVMCHVPAKATSGRGISNLTFTNYISQVPPAATFSTDDKKILAEWGISITLPLATDAALQFPVAPNNFKDMIHGIHKGRERVTPFMDARDRTTTNATTGVVTGAITLLDFRRMDFPGVIKNCETCHVAGTYLSVPTGALASTYESVNTAGNTTTALANSALRQPNATDKVTSPYAAACVSCHDSSAAQGHMATNGGKIQVARSVFATAVATPGQGEACATCHGPGRAEDIAVKHK